MTSATHRDTILDQFTRQAIPFATAPGIQDEQALRLVVEFSGAGPHDTEPTRLVPTRIEVERGPTRRSIRAVPQPAVPERARRRARG